MKFFIALYSNWFMDFEVIEKVILEADRLGFDGVLMPDHYMFGEELLGFRPDANETLESWIALTYLASKTEEIHLGTLVSPIPLRPPGILAKMVATLDVLSAGRVIVGIGAGWSQVEFEGYSEWDEPKVRVDKTIEGLELMMKLWTQDEVTHEGKYYKAKTAVLEPKPIQKPYPQLLFGGNGDRMLKLAGKYADICYLLSNIPPQVYDERIRKILKAAAKFNRAGKLAFMGGDLSTRVPYHFKLYAKKVELAIEKGASYFLTSFPRDEEFINSIRRFATELIPSFK